MKKHIALALLATMALSSAPLFAMQAPAVAVDPNAVVAAPANPAQPAPAPAPAVVAAPAQPAPAPAPAPAAGAPVVAPAPAVVAAPAVGAPVVAPVAAPAAVDAKVVGFFDQFKSPKANVPAYCASWKGCAVDAAVVAAVVAGYLYRKQILAMAFGTPDEADCAPAPAV
jgi:pyruvate dehydrogenase E2 component (dihydrolipoamide acetyltransferase)